MIGMHLGAGVARDEADDALDLLRVDPNPGVDPAFAQSVEPERPIGVDHDLDDLAVAHGSGDVGAERCDQHAPAPFCREVRAHAPSSGTAPNVRRPVDTCRPTCVTNASNRFAPSARPAWSFSASGVWMASSKRMNSASVSRIR